MLSLVTASQSWARSSRNLLHNKKKKTSGLTHGDDFVVTGTTGESVGAQEAAGERVSNPIQASQIRQRASKHDILGRNRNLYQHDPRHLDVLVESLGIEKGNTVLTPIIVDVKDENPVWLDSEQISMYRSHVARCFIRSEQLCRRMSDLSQHSFSKLKRLVRYLKGETMDPSFRTRGHEFRGGQFSRTQTGLETRKRGNRRAREWRSWEKPRRSRTVCSSIGSVRSERGPEHYVSVGFCSEASVDHRCKGDRTHSSSTWNRQNETHRS